MTHQYQAIVIGTSAGGLEALSYLFAQLTELTIPVIVVQHLSPNYDSKLANILNEKATMLVQQVQDKEKILPGRIYIAPPNYHLLIEKDYTFSLSGDEKVNFSRPAIDVLFETAADAFRDTLIGVLLTGANCDGAKGLLAIKNHGGYTIIQSPTEAYAKEMPESALRLLTPNSVLCLTEISALLSTKLKIQKQDQQ
ncbi:chemotaxis protein CheB [Psychromonas sp. MME2]|uniref:chemotaxis protein CheB n=1 Tax=unclassified Psychromonas TaxID=2614957 RepID=UPI00339C3487